MTYSVQSIILTPASVLSRGKHMVTVLVHYGVGTLAMRLFYSTLAFAFGFACMYIEYRGYHFCTLDVSLSVFLSSVYGTERLIGKILINTLIDSKTPCKAIAMVAWQIVCPSNILIAAERARLLASGNQVYVFRHFNRPT